MGLSKDNLFPKRHIALAASAKALAHPARIAILEVLAKRDSCVCGDIVDELPLSQATISQHLKAMKEAGIIKGQVMGRNVCYCINKASCAEVSAALQVFFNSCCCC